MLERKKERKKKVFAYIFLSKTRDTFLINDRLRNRGKRSARSVLSVKNGPRLTGPRIEICFFDNFQYQPDVLTCCLFLFSFFEQVRWIRRHIPRRSTWATSSRRILTPMAPEDPFLCLWWVFIILLFPVSFYLSRENGSRTRNLHARGALENLSKPSSPPLLFPPFLHRSWRLTVRLLIKFSDFDDAFHFFHFFFFTSLRLKFI